MALSDLRGRRVVLYFYPKALTPGCTTQACGLRDNLSQFADFNAQVLGISPDPTDRLQKFRTKYLLNFDLISDPDHEVAKAYGVWGPKKFMGRSYMGVARTTFVIDEKGILIRMIDKFKTSTHHEDVLKELAALDHAGN